PAFDRDRVAPEPPDRRRQGTLRRGERRAGRCGQQARPREATRLRERTGERWERTPSEREPQIRVERPVEPFEVVGERDGCPTQVTMAAPLDMVRVWTGTIPASSHQPSCSRSGCASQYSSIDRPRNRPVAAHAGETIDPTSGITYLVYGRHAARAHPAAGTWNSRDAITPPGATTLASSFIVAAGSST